MDQIDAATRRVALRAGPLTMVFAGGDLRYICIGQHEVLRRVYVAVRDHNWATVPATISQLLLDVQHDHFQMSYLAEHRAGALVFAWRATITGTPTGELTFAMDGVARTTFLRNRIGICVHYPASCAGDAVQIIHGSGQESSGHFPRLVAPQRLVDGCLQPCPPFADVRVLRHLFSAGRYSELTLSGEQFELEDQRNWIDASFKLYGTPLAQPFPVRIQAGSALLQSLRFGLAASPEVDAPVWQAHTTSEADLPPVELHCMPATGALPRLGVSVASHTEALSARAIAGLQALKLSHLHAELDLSQATYPAQLARACAEANALGVVLALTLLLGNTAERELAELAAHLRPLATPIGWCLPLERASRLSQPALIAATRRALLGVAPGLPVAAGTNANFAELNRVSPLPAGFDLLCYAACPTVHADDDSSLAETPAGLAATIRTAHTLAAGMPLTVGPITLRPRFNPVATGPVSLPEPGRLPPEVDLRQASWLGAGWTLAALAALVEAGAQQATFYETTGWRGLIEREAGSPWPAGLAMPPGMPFPPYDLFAALPAFAGGTAAALATSDPLRAVGLRLCLGTRERLLLANLRDVPCALRLLGWHQARLPTTLVLAPHALAVLDAE